MKTLFINISIVIMLTSLNLSSISANARIIKYLSVSQGNGYKEKGSEKFKDSTKFDLSHQLDIYGEGFVDLFKHYSQKPIEKELSIYYRPKYGKRIIDFGPTIGGITERDQFKSLLFNRTTRTIEYGIFLSKKITLNKNHKLNTLIGYNRFNAHHISINNNNKVDWFRYGYKFLFQFNYVPNVKTRLTLLPSFLVEYRLTENKFSFYERENMFFKFGISINYSGKKNKYD